MTYISSQGSSALPGLQVTVDALNYVSSALQIRSVKAGGPDFYLIEATANAQRVFYVRGDGVTGFNSLITMSGGHTISNGGLYINAGGATIVDNGLFVYNSNSYGATNPVATISSTSTAALTSTYSVLAVTSVSTSSSHFLFTATNQVVTRFNIRADGLVMGYAGLTVTGGVSVGSSGLTVTGGVSVYTGGVVVTSGATIASGGLMVTLNGITVLSGGVNVNAGGILIKAGGVTVTAGGLNIIGGSLQAKAGVLVTAGGLQVTGGASIRGGGLTVSNGITVYNGGISTTGGASIFNLGLTITGGLTIYGTGLTFGGTTFPNVVASATPTSYYLTTTSDRRLKRKLAAVIEPLSKISKIKGIYFSWQKGSIEDDDRRHVGFIAQDVQEIMPEAVKEMHGEKYLGIDYTALVSLLVEAVKELHEKHLQLDSDVASFKQKSELSGIGGKIAVGDTGAAGASDTAVQRQSTGVEASDFEAMRGMIATLQADNTQLRGRLEALEQQHQQQEQRRKSGNANSNLRS